MCYPELYGIELTPLLNSISPKFTNLITATVDVPDSTEGSPPWSFSVYDMPINNQSILVSQSISHHWHPFVEQIVSNNLFVETLFDLVSSTWGTEQFSHGHQPSNLRSPSNDSL